MTEQISRFLIHPRIPDEHPLRIARQLMSNIGASHSLIALPELYTFVVVIPRQALLVSGDLEGYSYVDRIVSKSSMLWKLKDNRGLRVLDYFELDHRKVSARNT